MRPAVHHRLAVALFGVLALGTDWPGHVRELTEGFASATPAHRRAMVAQAGGADVEGAALVARALADPEVSVRLAAADVVARDHLAFAAPTLGAWLSDANPDLRAVAARTLGTLGASHELSGLVRALGDTAVPVRLNAIDAIASLEVPDAAMHLLDRVSDPESAVRIAAVRALGDAGDSRATLSLLGALQDPMPEVREAAARSLGLLADARAVNALLGLLRDPVQDVRLAAARALGTMGTMGAAGEPAVAGLASVALGEDPLGDAPARMALTYAAIRSLGAIGGEHAGDILVQVFRHSGNAPATARMAGLALGDTGPTARDHASALAAQPLALQLLPPLMETLGDLGGEAAAEALVTIARGDRYGRIQGPAWIALGRTGAPDVVVRLLTVAADAHSLDALQGLAAWAQRTGRLDGAAVDPLTDLLRQPADNARTNAVSRTALLARLLGATHNPRAALVLAPLLTATSPEVRLAAAEGMRSAGVDGAEDAAAAALGDPSAEARLAIADTLSLHGGPNALAAVVRRYASSQALDRASAVRALGRITLRTHDLRAVPWLLEALHNGSPAVKGAALDALADATAAGDDTARAALLAAVDDANLALPAVEALGNALWQSPVDQRARLAGPLVHLLEGGESSSLRATAAWGLSGAGANAVAPLVHALNDPHAAVATNAAGALARMAHDAPATVAPARDALCEALATHTHPLTRANLLLALARTGAVCVGQSPRTVLRNARSPWVRAAAAEGVGLALRAAGDVPAARPLRAALARCAMDDTTPAVANRCHELLSASPDPLPHDDTVDMVVAGNDAVVGASHAFAIVLPDGVAREGVAGLEGWVHLRGVAHGRFAVIDPDTLADE